MYIVICLVVLLNNGSKNIIEYFKENQNISKHKYRRCHNTQGDKFVYCNKFCREPFLQILCRMKCVSKKLTPLDPKNQKFLVIWTTTFSCCLKKPTHFITQNLPLNYKKRYTANGFMTF